MTEVLDLRSDTSTKPTESMYAAMAQAPLGDDVLGEDPTVNRLQELAAQRMGKESALFVPSGTMGNLLAVTVLAGARSEVIVDSLAHTRNMEAGGMAAVAGATAFPVQTERGFIPPATIRAACRPNDQHFARTRLLVIENTHNFHGGACLSVKQMKSMAAAAHACGLRVHLDGARIFNAAVAQSVTADQLAAPCDTVTFCLSKGLSAPVGSVLCGSAEVIAEARRVRKMLGGGMRQAGVLAACGIVALEQMVDRLAEDHANARETAVRLSDGEDFLLDPDLVETNLLFLRVRDQSANVVEWERRCAMAGVLFHAWPDGLARLAFHRHIRSEHIDRIVQTMRGCLRS